MPSSICIEARLRCRRASRTALCDAERLTLRLTIGWEEVSLGLVGTHFGPPASGWSQNGCGLA